MKKLLCTFVLLCTMLCSCGEVGSDGISVVATLFPQYDFAREIAGESAEVELLLDLGADAHTYDPTPLDLIKIANADLFIYTGPEMELWAEKLLDSEDVRRAIESGSLLVLDLSSYVTLAEMHGEEEHSHEHEHDEHCEYDTHIWTSLDNAKKMCAAITDALCAIDKEGAYRQNYENYLAKLDVLCDLEDEVISEKSICEVYFGGSFAFRYLFSEMGLEHYSIYEGCASHAEASAADIMLLSNRIKENGIGYVFYDTLSEKKIAEAIAAESGAEVLHLHAIHNITVEEFKNGDGYISLMQKNIETLRKALS